MSKTSFIVRSAIIAALYFALTYVFQPISFGVVQFRISEVLTVLPFFTATAIPGLFVGCLLSNILLGGLGLLDMILGSAATLIAAFLTYKFKNKWLAPLPPVVVNGVLVGIMLNQGAGAAFSFCHGQRCIWRTRCVLWVGSSPHSGT